MNLAEDNLIGTRSLIIKKMLLIKMESVEIGQIQIGHIKYENNQTNIVMKKTADILTDYSHKTYA